MITKELADKEEPDLLESVHPSLPLLGNDYKQRMIKRYQRSAAGNKKDIPHLVRTEKALEKTLHFIWTNILDVDMNGKDPRFVDKEGNMMGELVFVRIKRTNNQQSQFQL